MWIALAVISFLAGQVYLFRCLRKLDDIIQQNDGEEAQKPSGNPS